MKNLIMTIMGVLLASSVAQASQCYLDADLSGRSFHLLVGGVQMEGEGVIRCLDASSNQWRIQKRVGVSVEGAGFGLGVTKIKHARLLSSGLGIIQSPDSLLGRFLFAKAGVQVGPVGAEAGTSVIFNARKGKKALVVPFSLNLRKGPGLELSLLDFLEVEIFEI